jgi:bifunctional non-homologous end joining protein LigD
MPLARPDVPFDHPDWIFELKWDGFRSVAHVDRSGCRQMSRNRNPFRTFPLLAAGTAEKLGRSTVIDGEIVCLGPDGKPAVL